MRTTESAKSVMELVKDNERKSSKILELLVDIAAATKRIELLEKGLEQIGDNSIGCTSHSCKCDIHARKILKKYRKLIK